LVTLAIGFDTTFLADLAIVLTTFFVIIALAGLVGFLAAGFATFFTTFLAIGLAVGLTTFLAIGLATFL